MNMTLSLLGLPTEIRKSIWHETLKHLCEQDGESLYLPGKYYNISSGPELGSWFSNKTCRWGREPVTRLLRVNKQIFAEAMEVLYSRFSLHVSMNTDLDEDPSLPLKLPEVCRKRIETINIHDIFLELESCWPPRPASRHVYENARNRYIHRRRQRLEDIIDFAPNIRRIYYWCYFSFYPHSEGDRNFRVEYTKHMAEDALEGISAPSSHNKPISIIPRFGRSDSVKKHKGRAKLCFDMICAGLDD